LALVGRVGRPCQRDVNARTAHSLRRPPTNEHGAHGESGSEQDECDRPPTDTYVDMCTHNPKVAGSNPAPATNSTRSEALSAPAGRASSAGGCQRLVNTRWRGLPCASFGARGCSCDLVGAVSLVSAATTADEHRRDRTGARCRLDHLGRNPKVAGQSAGLTGRLSYGTALVLPSDDEHEHRQGGGGGQVQRPSRRRAHQTAARPDRADGRSHRPMGGGVCGIPNCAPGPRDACARFLYWLERPCNQ